MEPSTRPTSSDPVVSVRDLTKVYTSRKGPDVTAVAGVSFDVSPGEVVGLLGPNGAGKTTIIKATLGLLIPSSGTATIAGVDVHRDTRRAYRHVSAVLEGNRNIYWRLTVRENLNYFAGLQGIDGRDRREFHDSLLSQLRLSEKADEPVKSLSRGMKQKAALGCALARETPVVFLDEPTLGLDVEASYDLRRELRRLASEEAKTIVLSSHDMDVVQELCDHVIIVNDGRVVADDTVEELVGVLRTQAYRITLDGRLPDRSRSRLDRRFEVAEWRDGADRTAFEVVLRDADEFYGLMDLLRESGAGLAGVTAVEPDLEDVFLRVTERGALEGAA